MIKSKKGLGDSIWASRGKAQYSNNSSSSTCLTRTYQTTSSVITPAAPRSPSPTKSDGFFRPGANTSTPALAPVGGVTKNGHAAPHDGRTAQQEFRRYIQIVRRLKWKLPFLSHGYHHAIARPGDPLYGGETDAEEAELMFKLDFYEYYMLLERALVHLMGVFGITVSRDGWVTTTAPRRADGEFARQATHTYHQNVIAALEREDNPLHEALGTGEVLFHLLRAKELRNRWKYAEEGIKARANGEAGRERAGTAPLESYDLDKIFRYVFAGFDAGYAVAERRVAEEAGVNGGAGGLGSGDEMEEDEYDFIVEAMDWEAV
ncbi:hypothetical protein LY78DRAFT_654460 [Colletotrichum sublineola]|uniref:Fungal specific transcription factor n=1 Tax=Colletotrichum sublineola TaxID=1173701 RepID=A0A066Y030_COLSU|nr:hypothetical protein LY78DRAFT_654460 [Colletotrichum sublineola]KDN71401.1 hypothetical protein CSUB01_06289 [Colletotrichum sublineola]